MWNSNHHHQSTTTHQTGKPRRRDTIILTHGFGSGLGFFATNVRHLLQSPNVSRVILVDWKGMGGSERPQCSQRPIRRWWKTNENYDNNPDTGSGTPSMKSWCDSKFTTSEAVRFFIDPFHEWMETSVLQNKSANDTEDDGNIVLVGHSLGGYLSARYVIDFPNTIHRLVLASPVGFPSRPEKVLKGSQLPTSLRIVDALWSSNWTPQQLVRMMGSTRGRRNIQRALQGRIPHLQQEEANLLGEYLYHITVADPSGEFAMNSLLEPVIAPDIMGVFARQPLEDQLVERLEQNGDVTSSSIKKIKVLFGDHDWMRPNEPSARNTLSKFQKIDASVHILPNAGHHLYLDNNHDFVRHILDD